MRWVIYHVTAYGREFLTANQYGIYWTKDVQEAARMVMFQAQLFKYLLEAANPNETYFTEEL